MKSNNIVLHWASLTRGSSFQRGQEASRTKRVNETLKGLMRLLLTTLLEGITSTNESPSGSVAKARIA